MPQLLGDVPLVIRFKSPDTLGFVIEELAYYRREVWPDAEKIDLKAEPVQKEEVTQHDLEIEQAGLLAFWRWFLEWFPHTSFLTPTEALDWLIARGERGYPFPPKESEGL